MSEIRQPQVGDVVIFVDEHAKRHNALLTAVHGTSVADGAETYHPAVNVVFVTDDSSKTDPYGSQIERETSVVHRISQSAHGMYWEYPLPGEVVTR